MQKLRRDKHKRVQGCIEASAVGAGTRCADFLGLDCGGGGGGAAEMLQPACTACPMPVFCVHVPVLGAHGNM
jgi:hypothetical protein